jgi:PAS domain S-box-containing protein
VYRRLATKDGRVTSLPTAMASPKKLGRKSRGLLSHDQLNDALMQAPALICVTRGPHHVIETVNELLLQSIGGRDVIGQTMRGAFPDAPDERIAILDRAYTTGEPHSAKEIVERVLTDATGEERFLNLTVQPLKDSNGAIYGVMTHAVDVTEQVRTRQQLSDLAFALERTNRELDSFAYAASHDLRAPLRGIANLAQWIEEDLAATDQLRTDTREMLELMRIRMHRMEGLIEGLLQYSRAGRGHQDPVTVDVATLITDVVDLLSPPGHIAIEIDPELPTIQTERLLLQQVFMNLIGNAVKHADQANARIAISSKRVGPFYEFSVSDNGPGIAQEYHDRIWGIFQTLESRDRVEGAGIGLALVKKIVENQRGRAWVESAPGSGATFRFLWRK